MKRRHHAVMTPMSSINVTSLLDIVFVLLISFMIVAPALRSGVNLELPTVSNAPALKEGKPLAISVVPVAFGTEIYVNGQVTQLDALVIKIKAAAGGEVGRPVTLEGDKRVDWQDMAEIITELREGGVTQVGIVTKLRET